MKLIDASDDDLVTSASLIERQEDATDEPVIICDCEVDEDDSNC